MVFARLTKLLNLLQYPIALKAGEVSKQTFKVSTLQLINSKKGVQFHKFQCSAVAHVGLRDTAISGIAIPYMAVSLRPTSAHNSIQISARVEII